MTVTYNLQSQPEWYIPNNLGLPATGGYIFTLSSLNKNAQKVAYLDPAGLIVAPNPIPIEGNGMVQPIYFKFDTANPSDLYYIRVCNSDDIDDLLWDFDGIPTATSGGGGSPTENYNLTNLITNNVMFRHIGNQAGPLPAFLIIAPGAHAGLSQTASNYGPDICFIKNNAIATDSISFVDFTPVATLAPADVTPQSYLNYHCTTSVNSETSKLFQFPITKDVINLASMTVSFTMWVQLNSGSAVSVVTQLAQFFGDGGAPSSPVITNIASTVLTSTWTQIRMTLALPNITAATLGSCKNDGLFLQVVMPNNTVCDINFTKPALYLGGVSPSSNFVPYDVIESQIASPRTGSIMAGFIAPRPFGYLLMDDGTIGSAASGATSNSGAGASVNTFALYNLLWNNVIDTYAPVTGGRGASAVADFVANKPMGLTKQLGRVIASQGLPSSGGQSITWALGQVTGNESAMLNLEQYPNHKHDGPAAGQFATGGVAGAINISAGANASLQSATGGVTGYTGGFPGTQQALVMQPPTAYMNVYIKL